MQEPSYTFATKDGENGSLCFHLSGSIQSFNAASFIDDINNEINSHSPTTLIFDLEKLTLIDDFGVSALAGFKKNRLKAKGTFQLTNIPEPIQQTLKFHNFDKLTAPIAVRSSEAGLFTQLGTFTLKSFKKLSFACCFLGDTLFSFGRLLRRPLSLRTAETITNMRRVGVDALPIVSLISFLLGLIMAFMSSVQLKQFGANIYVASLVALSMTRELGPIMTAIIVAGRSASAFAAELGAMKISEEIDALFIMGIDPHQYLVLPRIIAACLTVPLLTLFSDLFAIAGGLLVGKTMLGLTVDGYINHTIRSLSLFDVFWGFYKSAVFALFLSWIGCFYGFQVKEGAADVGRATTSAVVTSIFMIILIDSVMVVILRYWQ